MRVKGDEFWHMTKVLRLGINDRYIFHGAWFNFLVKVLYLDEFLICYCFYGRLDFDSLLVFIVCLLDVLFLN